MATNLIKNGDFATDTIWVKGAGTTISGGNAAWVGTGATPESIVAQPNIEAKEGFTYRVYTKVLNTVLAAGDTYAVITLGGAGGTSYQFTGNQTWDETTPLYLVCGTSPASGLEITTVNGTLNDTMNIDDVAAIVEQETESTNEDELFASGNIRVPADVNQVTNGTFEADTDWSKGVGWTIGGGTATSDGTVANLSQGGVVTGGKTSLVKFDVTGRTVGDVGVRVGSNAIEDYSADTNTSHSFITLTEPSGTDFVFRSEAGFDGSLDNVEVYELTAGPIDRYLSSGTEGGQTKYTSSLATHADGVGGTSTWDLWWNGVDSWIVSLTAGTEGTNYWSRTDASQIGDYTPVGNTTGTLTVTYGPSTDGGGGLRGRQNGGGRYAGFRRSRYN